MLKDSRKGIEDITWPRRDTKFLFKCWKIFHEWAQRTSEMFFQHEKRNFVSLSNHVMFYLLYKHQWITKPFHFNGILVYVAIAKVIFSHVKISSFRTKAHLVFHWWLYNKFYYSLEGFLLLLLCVFHQMTWPVSSLQTQPHCKGSGPRNTVWVSCPPFCLSSTEKAHSLFGVPQAAH